MRQGVFRTYFVPIMVPHGADYNAAVGKRTCWRPSRRPFSARVRDLGGGDRRRDRRSGQTDAECVLWGKCWSFCQRVYAPGGPRGISWHVLRQIASLLPGTLRKCSGEGNRMPPQTARTRWRYDQHFFENTHSPPKWPQCRLRQRIPGRGQASPGRRRAKLRAGTGTRPQPSPPNPNPARPRRAPRASGARRPCPRARRRR